MLACESRDVATANADIGKFAIGEIRKLVHGVVVALPCAEVAGDGCKHGHIQERCRAVGAASLAVFGRIHRDAMTRAADAAPGRCRATSEHIANLRGYGMRRNNRMLDGCGRLWTADARARIGRHYDFWTAWTAPLLKNLRERESREGGYALRA
jgi:hypothetical protein